MSDSSPNLSVFRRALASPLLRWSACLAVCALLTVCYLSAADEKAAPAAASRPAASTATSAAQTKAALPVAPAKTPAAPALPAPSLRYESFSMIVDRNIFNPYRLGPSTGRSQRSSRESSVTPFIALVGTMRYEKGFFAFFDGYDPKYRKAVKSGDSIAGFVVSSVEQYQVQLTKSGKSFTMLVSQQLRRNESEAWALDSTSNYQAPDPNQAAAADPTAPPEIPANASEVLKRLMEKRQKQLKQ
jgi:hypothetical protein